MMILKNISRYYEDNYDIYDIINYRFVENDGIVVVTIWIY